MRGDEMKTIELKKENIYFGNLLLVNAEHPIKTGSTANLVPADRRFPDILMKRDAMNVLQFVFDRISAGNSIVPVSGYRSSEEQTDIYNTSLKENGEDFTKKYVALPNHSEHQTGLAIDLGLNKEEIDFICPDFPYEGICHEFREAAPDYGFIQRYAKDKEKITGISHEPWHFRYVGYPHSKIMNEKGLALEEYTEFIKTYRNNSRYIYRRNSDTGAGVRAGAETETYYIPANDDITQAAMPDNCVYQISGNNIDGFIATVWGI